MARPYLDVVSAASDAVELANRIQADTTVLSDTLKQALDSNANLAALAGGLTKTQLLARQNSGAYQALATIAAQYGKTVEDITPILEDLGYLQKEVAGSTEDLKDEQGQLNDIWAAARSAGDDNLLFNRLITLHQFGRIHRIIGNIRRRCIIVFSVNRLPGFCCGRRRFSRHF